MKLQGVIILRIEDFREFSTFRISGTHALHLQNIGKTIIIALHFLMTGKFGKC